MWKYLGYTGVFGFAVLDAVISWAISWILVFKFEWRMPDLLGTGIAYDDNASFVLYLVTLGITIIPLTCLFGIILAFELTDSRRSVVK